MDWCDSFSSDNKLYKYNGVVNGITNGKVIYF